MVHRVYHFGAPCVPFWCTVCTILVHRVYHFGAPCVPFWCTVCTILVHRVYRVYHFGAPCVPCVPFWCTWCTVCTILVYHFGVLGVPGVPFWCTILVYLVYLVYHFGVPFWCTWCTATRETPLRITSQFPKNEPDPGNTPPDHHGTFEKSPTKPPPGLTARLSSPHTDRAPPVTRNNNGHSPHPAGTVIHPAGTVIHPEAPNDHPTKAGSPTTAELQQPITRHFLGQVAQISSRGFNQAVLGPPVRTRNRQHRPSRQNR